MKSLQYLASWSHMNNLGTFARTMDRQNRYGIYPMHLKRTVLKHIGICFLAVSEIQSGRSIHNRQQSRGYPDIRHVEDQRAAKTPSHWLRHQPRLGTVPLPPVREARHRTHFLPRLHYRRARR